LSKVGASTISAFSGDAAIYQTLASKRLKGPVGPPPIRADPYR